MINKHITKSIIKIWLIILLLLSIAPLASAEGEDTPAPQTGSTTLTCDKLNKPEDNQGWVISITEEEFAYKDLEKTEGTMLCARETICSKEGTGDKTEIKCESKYKDLKGCTATTGATGDEKTVCQKVQVFYAKTGIDLLYAYIGTIYKWSAGTIGIVAVFYLVYGGIKISTAGDNTQAIDDAKTKIGRSIAGLVILFLSALILYTINPNFFVL